MSVGSGFREKEEAMYCPGDIATFQLHSRLCISACNLSDDHDIILRIKKFYLLLSERNAA